MMMNKSLYIRHCLQQPTSRACSRAAHCWALQHNQQQALGSQRCVLTVLQSCCQVLLWQQAHQLPNPLANDCACYRYTVKKASSPIRLCTTVTQGNASITATSRLRQQQQHCAV